MAEQTLQLHNDTTSVKGTAILGRLTGPCADIINPTRNGRKYTEALWDKTFKNPIVLEYFDCGGIFGELGHPADRSETDMEKIAICMPEPPKKNPKTGQLEGSWDILDTPNGRIAHTLAKYGYKLGISSRGTGDVYTDTDGAEAVDEDTYDFQAFDLVLLPAVKAARLSMTESLNKDNGLKVALSESLNKATADDRKIMMETLNNLHIDYSQPNKVVDNIDTKEVADNNGTDLAKQLQEALTSNKKLSKEIIRLRSQLSVGNAKVENLESKMNNYRKSIGSLTESLRRSQATQKHYESAKHSMRVQQKELQLNESTIHELKEQVKDEVHNSNHLTQQLARQDELIKHLKDEISDLRVQLSESENLFDSEKSRLNESYSQAQQESQKIQAEYKTKLEHSDKLVEKFRGVAKTAVNKYIESQAVRLGVDSNEIKNKLPENYSFDDIDSVCESLQDYKVAISSLPFKVDTTKVKPQRMTIKESGEHISPDTGRFDDCVDAQLMSLANL